jgi:hypothetical protein
MKSQSNGAAVGRSFAPRRRYRLPTLTCERANFLSRRQLFVQRNLRAW